VGLQGLPDLRWRAGIGLTVLPAVMVIANINVAIQGGAVKGLDAGACVRLEEVSP